MNSAEFYDEDLCAADLLRKCLPPGETRGAGEQKGEEEEAKQGSNEDRILRRERQPNPARELWGIGYSSRFPQSKAGEMVAFILA